MVKKKEIYGDVEQIQEVEKEDIDKGKRSRR